MNMTVFTICYNEEFFLPYFIAHYRERFPGCKIVVYDNESTDSTVDIARAADCEVRTYSTGGQLSDAAYLEIKNNCWKHTYGWAIVADVDELCDIATRDILYEARKGNTILRFCGYNMVNLADTLNIPSIRHGVRSESYDKMYCFNAILLRATNYGPGCHHANPVGTVRYSQRQYTCRHYKYIQPDYMVQRHAHYATRLSPDNIARGYGGHYLYTEEQIRAEFETARSQARQIF